jgi:hypothetical protein
MTERLAPGVRASPSWSTSSRGRPGVMGTSLRLWLFISSVPWAPRPPGGVTQSLAALLFLDGCAEAAPHLASTNQPRAGCHKNAARQIGFRHFIVLGSCNCRSGQLQSCHSRRPERPTRIAEHSQKSARSGAASQRLLTLVMRRGDDMPRLLRSKLKFASF